ncbi:hypothetical protein [Caballeronia telluris]|jgi:hypothetical protein|uniref:Flagellar hook-length control protein n=1 Tax=Caballeronia telluris TaxID=326475 RepID=A0A158J3V4_9BURK|nr:hypothetical protein [Caballeronia telluris]SAL63538.1 hypothetical protein AWB66_03786 [Caballeronia telluris]
MTTKTKLCILALTLLASHTAFAAGGKGMTWFKTGHANGVDSVSCTNTDGTKCDAYQGDTACSIKLPVLCINQDGAPGPVPSNSYNGWAKGNIGLSRAVRGDTMTSLADGNAICRGEFGPGYRMAEFHDGSGGWGWQAYGNIDGSSRFWVTTSDQSSNCWNK